MKFNRFATASAFAVTAGAFYILCRVFVGLFPQFSFEVAQAWFHGLATTPQMMKLVPGNFILGLVATLIVAFGLGWCLAHCYNMFAGKKK